MINLKKSQILECKFAKILKNFRGSLFCFDGVSMEFYDKIKERSVDQICAKMKAPKSAYCARWHGRYKMCDKNSTKEIGFEILNRFPWNWPQNLTIKTATKETVENYCISKIEVCKILRLNYFRKTLFKQLRFSKYYIIFGMAAMPLPL